jgi:cysteine/glycine-rich protein
MPSDILAEQEASNNAPQSPALPSRSNTSPPLPQRPATATQGSQIRQDSVQSNASWKEPETTKPSSTGYLSQKTSYVPRKFNFNSQNDMCTSCGKAVYAAELVNGSELLRGGLLTYGNIIQ